jgi:catechol 2,3-dioxygenase-like lactoylglutathione lyase family enzyme
MMIDHIALAVSALQRSCAFYEASLRPLGIEKLLKVTPEQKGTPGTAIGFGAKEKPFFWISDNGDPGRSTHIAFAAETRGQVRAFYEAALAAGGGENGLPGLRPWYHPNYYGAFVLDPDGINVEAVCHQPEQ